MTVRAWLMGWVILAVVSTPGCVRRRMTIRSNPPGAMVYIDDQQIGLTPVSTSFTYYGTRKFTLVKDPYETVTTYHTISAPWYQLPVLDFVFENVVGREYRDERVLEFQLQPQRIIPQPELMARAAGLRSSIRQGYVVPSPAAGAVPASVNPPSSGMVPPPTSSR